MVLLNHINSALTRQERHRLNENWDIIRDAFLNVQRQFKILMGDDLDVILDNINEIIRNSEANAALLEPLIADAQAKIEVMISETNISKQTTADTKAATIEYQSKLIEIDSKLTEMTNTIKSATDATNKAKTATTNANTATTNANTATTNANTAAQKANESSAQADIATQEAVEATSLTNQATSNANTAIQNANKAASDATASAQEADFQATRAENATETATTLINSISGHDIPISSFSLEAEYIKHQPVRSNGSTYRVKVDKTKGNPLPVLPATSNTWFELEAQKGDKGDKGDKGVKGDKGDKGDTGATGPQGVGVTLLGTKEKESDLPVSNNVLGHAWLINGVIHIWDGTKWVNGGDIQGPRGETAIWSTSIDYIINATDTTQVTYSNGSPIIKPTGYTYTKDLDTVEVVRNSRVLYPGVDYTITPTSINVIQSVTDQANTTFYIRVQRLVTAIDPSISKSTIVAALGYEPANATLLADTARQTVSLTEGVSIVSSDTATLADVEIEGRTLVSLGNSNLEGGKKYILADPKTKLITDGKTISGVDKFIKGSTTVSKADFVGKVAGSTVENPHGFYTSSSSTLGAPVSGIERGEFVITGNGIGTLDGKSVGTSQTTQGNMSIHRFSFNLVEEIERKLGRIPKNTIEEKIQWIKTNLNTFTINWHGYGSSPTGNKASLGIWRSGGTEGSSGWSIYRSHEYNIVNKLSFARSTLSATSESALNGMDTDGYLHFIAYAEPSDGITQSTISTDYVELVLELNTSAQLDTRPKYIRVANFEGKVSGSNVENPHIAKWDAKNTLIIPNSFVSEFAGGYVNINSLDGNRASVSTPSNGSISQQLFSFNLIEEVERNIGKIPRATVEDKVAWLRNNILKFTGNWHGFGSSPIGNRSIFRIWRVDTSDWVGNSSPSHALNSVSKLSYSSNFIALDPKLAMTRLIDNSGFINFLAYAEPSDGVTPSVINTDYIELEIELKPTADFSNPKIPLYEVTDTEYSKALVEWNASEVMKRFPVVQGMQHIQRPLVTAEGENLLEAYTNYAHKHTTLVSLAPYSLTFDTTNALLLTYEVLTVAPNTIYTLTINTSGLGGAGIFEDNNNSVVIKSYIYGEKLTFTFNSGDRTRLRLYLRANPGSGIITYSNWIFSLGNTPKSFVPRNTSNLVVDMKLGAIGNVKDILFKRENRWYLRKTLEKDIIVDGKFNWFFSTSFNDYKSVYAIELLLKTSSPIIINDRGRKLPWVLTDVYSMPDSDLVNFATSSTILTIPNSMTGFTKEYVPIRPDIQRYFNGWKYTDGTTWISVTGNGQTATAQQALDTKPTDYIPYKLSYVLTTPQVIDITDKVEGSLKLNGLTQVEVTSGVILKEKVTPRFAGGEYRIGITEVATSRLKQSPYKIVSIYKNGINDTNNWTIAYGASAYWDKVAIYTPESNVDPAAEYTVTYIPIDKSNDTVPPTNVKLIYANSIRNALDDTVRVVQDNLEMLSVHEKAIVDLYIKMKALEGI